MADTKWSQFPSATPDSADEVVGLHAGGNVRFPLANLVYAVRNGLGNIFQRKITASGILKGDGAGGVTAATAGTDYGTYSKPSGGIPASDLANGVIPTVPSAYTSNPAMDGTASPGSSNDYARGDHVHPENPANAKTAQLAYVESGTTASRNYAVGEYFCWNGLLYRVKTAISSGASFTPGTNCEQVTEGGLNSVAKTSTVNNPVAPSSGVTLVKNIARISGNVVSLTLYVSSTMTLTNGMNIGTISTDLIPAEDYEMSCDVFSYSTGQPLGGAVWLTRSNRRVDYYGPTISANAQKVLRIVYLKQ